MMNRKLVGLVVKGLLLALPAARALGQTSPAPTESWQTTFFNLPGKVLPLLTQAAIEHSAAIKALDLEKAIGQQDIALARKSILASVALNGIYNYGNLASITLADPNNPNQFTTFSSNRYAAGVSLTLPLDRIASRGNLIEKQQLIYQRSESLRQEREDLVRQQIIQLYQNVLLARKLLTLRQEAYVSAQTGYQLAEKQFRQGQLTLPAFTQANTQFTDVALNQETARNQYDTAFMMLESVVGTRISTLLATVR